MQPKTCSTQNCTPGAFGYDIDAFGKRSRTPLFEALAYLELVDIFAFYRPLLIVHSHISGQRTYPQILVESIVDKLPASALRLLFLMPTKLGSALKYHLDVMRSTSVEMFSLGLDAARNGDADRTDLLSVLGMSSHKPITVTSYTRNCQSKPIWLNRRKVNLLLKKCRLS